MGPRLYFTAQCPGTPYEDKAQLCIRSKQVSFPFMVNPVYIMRTKEEKGQHIEKQTINK